MQSIIFTEFGGPEVLKMARVTRPRAGDGQIVVEMKAIGLNFADVYRRRGEYTLAPPSPYVLGYEGAGVVHEVGANVEGFGVGDRVAFGDVARANAEYVLAPAAKLVRLPEGVSFDDAAALMLQGMTAHYLTHDSYKLQAGDVALVHSASGGVGQYLLQIARILGARPIGIVSSVDKKETALKAGAESVLVSSREDFVAATLQFTAGRGADVVYDAVGLTLKDSFRAVKKMGHVAFYGMSGGLPEAVDPMMLMSESKTISGGDLWDYVGRREDLLRRSSALFAWVAAGKLKTSIAANYPLAQAADAHRFLESRKAQGKILLIP